MGGNLKSPAIMRNKIFCVKKVAFLPNHKVFWVKMYLKSNIRHTIDWNYFEILNSHLYFLTRIKKEVTFNIEYEIVLYTPVFNARCPSPAPLQDCFFSERKMYPPFFCELAIDTWNEFYTWSHMNKIVSLSPKLEPKRQLIIIYLKRKWWKSIFMASCYTSKY